MYIHAFKLLCLSDFVEQGCLTYMCPYSTYNYCSEKLKSDLKVVQCHTYVRCVYTSLCIYDIKSTLAVTTIVTFHSHSGYIDVTNLHQIAHVKQAANYLDHTLIRCINCDLSDSKQQVATMHTLLYTNCYTSMCTTNSTNVIITTTSDINIPERLLKQLHTLTANVLLNTCNNNYYGICVCVCVCVASNYAHNHYSRCHTLIIISSSYVYSYSGQFFPT